MAVAAKKIETDAIEHEVMVEASDQSAADVIEQTAQELGVTASVSPAKVLQDKLDAHYAPVTKTMSSRYVTLLVMFTCLGTWVSGVGLYATV